MSAKNQRIEWRENREHGDGSFELFFIIAERDGAGWHFFERSSFEVRWFRLESTPDLIEKADSILAREIMAGRAPENEETAAWV